MRLLLRVAEGATIVIEARFHYLALAVSVDQDPSLVATGAIVVELAPGTATLE